jgi:hypothetical protein
MAYIAAGKEPATKADLQLETPGNYQGAWYTQPILSSTRPVPERARMSLMRAARLCSLVLLSMLLASPAGALAQTAEPSRARSIPGQSWVQVTLSPASAAEGELRFTFEGSEPTPALVSVGPVPLNPTGGQPGSARDVPGAAGWITLNPARLTMRPATAEVIRYRVEVPAGTPPGDHSALVVLETEFPRQRAATRLTVSVPGEVRQQAALLSFGSQKEPLRLLFFELPFSLPLFGDGPIQFRGQLQNQGNVQFTASGRIRITDLFGAQQQEIALPGDQVFPGESGTFVANWTNKPTLGLFTAQLSIDAAGSRLTSEEHLLILTWQPVLAALVVAIAFRLLLGPHFGLPLGGRRRATGAPPSSAVVADNEPAARAETAPAEQPAPTSAPTPEPALAEQAEPVASGAASNGKLVAAHEAAAAIGMPVAASKQHQLEVDDLLRWGQQAARAGDRLVAYRLFVQAVKLDPTCEDAWLWRAGTAERPDEARECLEQVLQINPNNERARRGVEEIARRYASQGS